MKSLAMPIAVLSFCGCCLGAQAADWPQWRGPLRNGVSQEKGLVHSWPAAGPRLAWEVKNLDAGFSTPAVSHGKLFLICNKGMDEETVRALSDQDGKTLWSTRIGQVGNPDQNPNYPGSRSTPTVDGDLLYALGSNGDLVCLETGTGKLRWKKNLRAEFGGQPGIWAYAESPLVDGDKLICTPGGAAATIVALNKRTGQVIWQSAVPGGDQAGYASAIVVETGGRKQYVQFVQKGLVGVDAATGKFLWRYEETAKKSAANIPTPIAHDGAIYSATGQGGGGLVRLHPGADGVTAEPAYFAVKMPNSIGGSVLVDGYLYGTNNSGALMCVDFATGQVKWQERCVGPGSVCYADGLLFVHGENGQLALVEPSPDAYHEKGMNTPQDLPQRPQGAKAWAYPVVSNGKLYIRDEGNLWCYNVAAH